MCGPGVPPDGLSSRCLEPRTNPCPSTQRTEVPTGEVDSLPPERGRENHDPISTHGSPFDGAEIAAASATAKVFDKEQFHDSLDFRPVRLRRHPHIG